VSAADPSDRLNWMDPDAIGAFLDDVTTLVEDLATVAEDQTAALAARMYGRAGAREKIDEATAGLRSRLAYARRGLSEGKP
jgi:hypothetical protein